LYHHDVEPFGALGAAAGLVDCCVADDGACIGAIEGACGAGPTDIEAAAGEPGIGEKGAALTGFCIPGGGDIIWAAGCMVDGAGGAGAVSGPTGENCSCSKGISWTGTGVIIGDGPFGPMSKSRTEGGYPPGWPPGPQLGHTPPLLGTSSIPYQYSSRSVGCSVNIPGPPGGIWLSCIAPASTGVTKITSSVSVV
jgi:hypothetical protein